MKQSSLSSSMNMSSPLNHFRDKNDGNGPVNMLEMMKDTDIGQIEMEKIQEMDDRARSRLSEYDNTADAPKQGIYG